MRQPENDAPTRGIAVLGSTGSIGTQALEVIREQKEALHVEVLSANSSAELLVAQALEFRPNAVVIGDDSKWKQVNDALFDHGIKVYSGNEALEQVVETDGIDMVLTAMVGAAGLKPTMSAISAGKHIALANKETLVVAGELVMKAAQQRGVAVHPVDSEHSAIYQCLAGESHNPIEKVILTASGGPFRGRSLASLEGVTKADALRHPNWEMGAKITIDSASLMNKGLEVIEAKWLFDVEVDQIDVVVHPQSIVHSCVQFEDGSIKAQLGLPDMKLPIQYALTFPRRLANDFPRFDFMKHPSLTFERPDTETFRNLALAFAALKDGGNSPAILNAANEVAVARFLKEDVEFLDLPRIVEHAMGKVSHQSKPSLEDLLASDQEARRIAAEWKR